MPLIQVGGVACLEVTNLDGEVLPYPVRGVTPPGVEVYVSRIWRLVAPSGSEYDVTEFTDGSFKCVCEAGTLGKNRGGHWCEITVRGNPVPCCKHVRAVWESFVAPKAVAGE